MLIERILYPVETLGPGKRITIWTIGCSKRCPNCISPELWERRKDKNIAVPQLFDFVSKVMNDHEVDGMTISGGDPLEQADELLEFLERIYPLCPDILIYTGYTLAELQKKWSQEQLNLLMNHSAVLIDGRYINALNDNKSPLKGSTNQTIYYFNKNLQSKYEQYCRDIGRHIQNIYYGEKLLSVGIFNKEEQTKK